MKPEMKIQVEQKESVEAKTSRLLGVLTVCVSPIPSLEEREWFVDRVRLLQRQANKTKNQRKTLRNMNRAHRAAILELGWLREVFTRHMGRDWVQDAMKISRASMWTVFKKLYVWKGAYQSEKE